MALALNKKWQDLNIDNAVCSTSAEGKVESFDRNVFSEIIRRKLEGTNKSGLSELRLYGIDRIVAAMDIDLSDIESYLQPSYYDSVEVADVVLLGEATQRIQKKLKEFFKLDEDINKIVPWLLKNEYGYLLKGLESCSWNIQTIEADSLQFLSKQHYHHLSKPVLDRYQSRLAPKGNPDKFMQWQKDLPLGVVTPLSEGFRAIDGYHRMSTAMSIGNKKLKVIVAK